MLQEFAPSLYMADGPAVPFYGFPYPTRMAMARLSDGSAWVWSPVALTEELARDVEAIGPVGHIVSPNKLHHLFLGDWAERWPEARLHAPPGLVRKRPDLRFDAELGDAPDPAWAADIDQVIFRGSFAMEEVAFFHRTSRTALICDLVQRHPEAAMTGWRGVLMRLDGLVGARGSTPREWRASFLRRGPARAARDQVLGWQAERLLIAHGDCAESNATAILADALAWI
ncbi:MAG: DUF4336 domain-containing protein [Alphaproteobacteria bacterium]|nr:DUF4336 domain-containing protein [Alphaproteobacteria bacterium]